MSKLSNRKALISRLTHYVTFLENTTQSRSADPVWEEKFKCFAEILPLNDCQYTVLEGLNFGNFITEEYYVFKIRYMRGVSKDLQISFNNKLYSIKRIINIRERNKILNIITQQIS